MEKNNSFKFEISLSILNHLGRNLYRNFITVIGEALSNSWDANANNVWIYIDRDNGNFVIKDDGDGMDIEDFQGKFLKVGYSKRKVNGALSSKGRPYIGAKGIGKLALLSCAERVSVISKKDNTEYVGGVIDNSELTEAITDDLLPEKYHLGEIDYSLFEKYTKNHKKGTIIYFEALKEDIKNTTQYLKKLIALYFRFSLIDPNFKIFIENEPITIDDLEELVSKTQFLWNINDLKDPYIDKVKSEPIKVISELNFKGFIAAVEKPRYLKISGTEEKIGIDLFVNGRLREKDILKHLPDFSTRHIASYLYGQLHYNELDADGHDRFGTSRESIIPGDKKYEQLINQLKNEILSILSKEWDELRLGIGEDGDIDIVTKERKALSLFNLSSKEYKSDGNKEIDSWIKELKPDAEFNIPAYVDCFLSENLVRKHVKKKELKLESVKKTIEYFRNNELLQKRKGNINIDIRESNDDIFYLDMEKLVGLADSSKDGYPDTLLMDEKVFTPIRNAVMHTARLTSEAKKRLTTVYDNIKARIKKILINP